MAVANDLSTFDGLFKVQYHSDLENLIPQHVLLQNGLIDWVPSDKQNGEYYSVPTLLRSNQGVSYLGESGAVSALKSPKPGQMREAQIKGSEINVRGQISYKALSQAAQAGARAFKKSSAWLVEDLANVAHTRIEIAALYGQTGLGVIDTATSVGGGTYDLVIQEAEFAAGIWVLLEGATVEFFNGTNIVGTNLVGTIKQVTTSTRTVRVDLSGTGTPASGNTIFPEGAALNGGSFQEMTGLYKQLTATSGTLFAIDRGAYALMQGNVKNIGGPITKAKVIDASMLAVDKGCLSDLVMLVGTKAWAALAAEDMALRMFDSSYSSEKSESGSKEIIYEKVGGSIKVMCHPLVKNGHAFILNPEDAIWVGSSKPTFEIPGMSEKFFRLVDGSNAVELQNYADLAIYILKPCQTVVLTGITYA